MTDPYLHIEDYILGHLSAADKALFEQKLQSDVSLQKELALTQEAHLISQDLLELELRGILDKVDYRSDTAPINDRKWSKWWLVLIAALLVIASYFMFSLLNTTSPPVAYAEVYESPNWPIVRGNNDNLLSEGISIALDGKDKEGIALIKQATINADDKNYWIAELYAHTEQVDSTLHYIALLQGSKYKTQRIQYLEILSYYKLGNQAKVDQLLRELEPDTDKWYLDRYKQLK